MRPHCISISTSHPRANKGPNSSADIGSNSTASGNYSASTYTKTDVFADARTNNTYAYRNFNYWINPYSVEGYNTPTYDERRCTQSYPNIPSWR